MKTDSQKLFENNLSLIARMMGKSAKESRRDPTSVALVAVTKTQSEEKVEAALACGLRIFGENRVQEAHARWVGRKNLYPDLSLRLIGPLQTNKVREAVSLFDVIETLDRKSLVDQLVKEMEKQGRFIPCFIQVNTGEEPQKAGVFPREFSALFNYARHVGLSVEGLMCAPPVGDPPALHFAFLQKMAQEKGLVGLSMGMSQDFVKAIPLGATHIRIGSALFGSRV